MGAPNSIALLLPPEEPVDLAAMCPPITPERCRLSELCLSVHPEFSEPSPETRQWFEEIPILSGFRRLFFR